MRKQNNFFAKLALPIVFLTLADATAQPISDAELTRRQSQQNEEAQSRLKNTSDVFTSVRDSGSVSFTLPQEPQCFFIRDIQWQGVDKFDWIKSESALVLNKCIGANGLRALQDHLLQRLVTNGFITSRVLVPEQNLSAGVLNLQLIVGRIGEIRDQGNAPGRQWMALPGTTGGVLNQRDLDQGLENIRRLAGQQGVEFDLVPGTSPGVSDIVIKHPTTKNWTALLTLDDSGADSTGKYQIGGIVTIDSPLHLYDSLTLTLNHNANMSSSALGSASSSINWNVPFGYWSALAGVNYSKYQQTVAGFNGGIVYSGRSYGLEIGAGYVPYRSTNAKLSVQFKLNRKVSQSYVDDSEINVQFRDVQGYEASAVYRQFLAGAVLDIGFGFKGSLPQQSKAPGLIVGEPDWNGRYQIVTANIGVSAPFKIGAQSLRYQGSLRVQHASKLLPSFEYISIGNRYSVRGFDGAATLSSESGWLWRNDIVWTVPQLGQDVYLAIDTGRVSGKNLANLLGSSLTGAALGLRGRYSNCSYDFTIGMPLQRPPGFSAKVPTFTAFISADF